MIVALVFLHLQLHPRQVRTAQLSQIQPKNYESKISFRPKKLGIVRRWRDQWVVYPCESGRIAKVGVPEEKNRKGCGLVVEFMKLTIL